MAEDDTVAREGREGSKFTVQVKVKADPTHEEAKGGLTRPTLVPFQGG